MQTERVSLRHVPGGPVTVALHEPAGRDEIAIEGIDTRAAVALLDRLLRAQDERVPAAVRLAAADRDALLAALHRHLWGDTVRSTLACATCGERFDLSFQLSALQRHLAASRGAWQAADGAIADDSGERHRVPAAEDELAAAGAGAHDAAARLAARLGVAAGEMERAAAALEAGAPIVDAELEATCAECGARQLSRFDLQSFVLQRLLDERPALLAEVHTLADGYGWSLREILALGRRTRRSLAAMVADARRRTSARTRRVPAP